MFRKIKNKKKITEKGFSLVESLIAIAILMISVMAPLVLANNSIMAAVLSQQQIVAFYLAQDALEWVINKKTSNRLVLHEILNGLDDCRTDIAPGHGCYIDTRTGNITQCGTSECTQSVLAFNSATGQYGYGSGNASPFKRYIRVTPRKLDPSTSAVIDASLEVTLGWKDVLGKSQVYKLKSNVLNW